MVLEVLLAQEQSRRLTDVDFWLGRQPSTVQLQIGGGCPPWYKHVSQFLPRSSGVKCLEVGVVPGSTLLFLASQHKYRCTGVDFSPRVHDVASAFSRQGIQAQFVQTDFLDWHTKDRFDFVYSCGFIEHFSDYQAVIERHWRLVCPEGLMLLTVPVLTPLQRLIRLITYERSKMQEVLHTHNLEIMNLDRLRRAVKACTGSTVVVSTHTREMTIWFGPNDPGVRRWTKPLFRPLRLVERLAHRVGRSSRWFSPEVLVVARKGL